jgi:hypothetical protein
MSQVTWYVYLNGVNIDTVFFGPGSSKREVEDSLIQHDAYDLRIKCFRGNPNDAGCNPLPTKATQ